MMIFFEKENNNEDYSDLRNQYNMIISLTENHSDNDYLQVMYEVRNQKTMMKLMENGHLEKV